MGDEGEGVQCLNGDDPRKADDTKMRGWKSVRRLPWLTMASQRSLFPGLMQYPRVRDGLPVAANSFGGGTVPDQQTGRLGMRRWNGQWNGGW